MNRHAPHRFLVVGINHHKADVSQREAFALTDAQQKGLLREAKAAGLTGAMVVATCNRTELYGRVDCPQPVVDLFLRYTQGSGADFQQVGFVKHGMDALTHLFHVTTGLDSLVLGDLQISQQVKQAYKQAQAEGVADSYMHKAMQHVLRAHKRARRETNIGTGAASVAHAAVQCIRRSGHDLHKLRILLVGAGKIGKVTLKNLMGLGAEQVAIINRNRARAERLTHDVDVRVADFENLGQEIDQADVIIVATGAPNAVVMPEHVLQTRHHRLFIDLAVPRNIDPAVGELPFQKLINMDDLGTVVDETAHQREAARPEVLRIIDEERAIFQTWLSEQRLTPTIKALTAKLEELKTKELAAVSGKLTDDARQEVARVTHRLVGKLLAQHLQVLRSANGQTDQIVEALHRLYDLPTESPS